MATAQADLFGGAITAVLPTTLFDASSLRQIPDSQEVLISHTDDLSVILEVLELVTEGGAGDSPELAIRFHFSSLAHDNTALSSSIAELALPPPPPTPSQPVQGPTTLVGEQVISKFNLSAAQADTVLVMMALWRIPSKNADLVLCVNYPVRKEGGEHDEGGAARAKDAFRGVVETLVVKDLGLFAG